MGSLGMRIALALTALGALLVVAGVSLAIGAALGPFAALVAALVGLGVCGLAGGLLPDWDTVVPQRRKAAR